MKSPLTRSARLSVVLFLVIGLFWVPGAGAQEPGECYPDGCGPGPTDPPPTELPVCDKNKTRVRVGEIVEVTCQRVPHGHRIRIIVDGSEVTSAVATPLATFRPLQTDTTTLSMDFAMPEVEPGRFDIHAVGPDYTVPVGNGLLIVDPGGGGGGGLAFTGTTILWLVLVAAIALLVGYALVRRYQDAAENPQA